MAEYKWCGFSEEELVKIRRQEENSHGHSKPPKQALLKQKTNRKNLKAISQSSDVGGKTTIESAIVVDETSNSREVESLSANGMVKLRIDEEGHVLEVLLSKTDESSAGDQKESKAKEMNLVKEVQDDDGSSSNEPKINDATEKDVSNDLSNLQKFELRQKLMEEQNKQRRALLTQAIANRQKKTQEENEKLLQIQKELLKLDSLVSADVAILRNRIEQASMEFNEAQKRYSKAEEEFVQAKLILFQRLEQKEKLTEHLCTIIEQNEQRKSEKLIKMMQELEMDVVNSDWSQNKNCLILPELCYNSNTIYKNAAITKTPSLNSTTGVSCCKNGQSSGDEQPNVSETVAEDEAKELPSECSNSNHSEQYDSGERDNNALP